jgi:hypothetical protein
VGSTGRERTRERAVSADRWGPPGSGRERLGRRRGWIGADRSAPLAASEREKEESVGAGWHRQAGSTCQGGGRAGLGLMGWFWAEMGFSIFLEFLMSFLFYFYRVFNSNLNQIKHVHKFKKYLGLSMMQQFMTHIVLTKINN